jgi:hypothetical protein
LNPNDLVYIGLLGFGLLLFVYDLKTMFAPDMRGRVIAFEDQYEKAVKACNCNGVGGLGRSHVNARVRLEDGKEIDIQVSPCLYCMDRVRVGSQIGINKVGDRLVGRRYIDLFGRGLRDTSGDAPAPDPNVGGCGCEGVVR